MAAVAARTAAVMAECLARTPGPGLHLVATPIGNLSDITLRAIGVLARADAIYCEDTRHSRTLTGHFGIITRLSAYHEHNADATRPEILARLARGEAVVLISDAGTPLVSDPGYKLVRAALDAGHRVTSLPGPSAALAALAQSGLPTDTFLFAGFLPAKSGARQSRLAELKAVPATLIFFEAPGRVAALLADIAQVLGPREVAIARELTKLHEELRRGPAATLAAAMADETVRGECVVLVAPPDTSSAGEVDDAEIARVLGTLLEGRRFKDAVVQAALTLGVAKGRVYDIGLAMRRISDAEDQS